MTERTGFLARAIRYARERPLLPVAGLLLAAVAALAASAGTRAAAAPAQDGGTPVLAAEAHLTTAVGGLERTNARAEVLPITGQPFTRFLRVTVRGAAPETNATQLTVPTVARVEKGDALLATFFVRGMAAGGKGPAQAEFLFERSTNPWTKSATQGALAPRDPRAWKQVQVPFAASESYAPGAAMVSLRFAFGPQTVEIGGLSVVNFGKTRTVDALVALAAERNLLGAAVVTVRRGETRQTVAGFGGNFAQPRYGAGEPMDAVGRYNLQNLRVVHARVGLPLNHWAPQKGVYREEGPARAALLQMQQMARRKIPIAASVWEGPAWMLPGPAEQNGKRLPPENYDECIEAIGRFLVVARDKYDAPAEYFSFNEPDYGVNFKFTPQEMADFIRQAGPRFRALGLKTKFLTADTANGANFPAYARPLLEDKTIAAYLGPLAFHSWDVLGIPDARYEEIAALGRQYNKPVWCTEAGHDAQLWQAPNPWESWQNALRTALAYEKTLRTSGASLIHYWTYQDNYPLVNKEGTHPFPVFSVVRQMEAALPPGSKVAAASSDHDELRALAAVGPKPGQFSVLLVNPIGTGKAIVSGLPPGATVSVVRSDAAAQRKTAGAPLRVDRNGRLTVDLGTRSVVTLLSPASRQAATPRRTLSANEE
uniref:GH30 / GH30_1 n=1 Tax=uncultured Armatimonadetes bacterium TaxID=157466 RepID=A0A6J4JF17_9BACT|nr:GH30 / GH30_1 [uncultured Armatimonadetes bacterium]